MQRVNLKSGGWVDLREQEDVPQKYRRAIQAISVGIKDVIKSLDSEKIKDASMLDLDLTEEQADAMLRLQEATVVGFLAGWSFPEELPNLQTVGDMPGSRFEAIAAIVAERGANLALDVSPGDAVRPDPTDRSGSSEPSSGLSRDDSVPATT